MKAQKVFMILLGNIIDVDIKDINLDLLAKQEKMWHFLRGYDNVAPSQDFVMSFSLYQLEDEHDNYQKHIIFIKKFLEDVPGGEDSQYVNGMRQAYQNMLLLFEDYLLKLKTAILHLKENLKIFHQLNKKLVKFEILNAPLV